MKAVDPEFLRVLERAGENIRAFHERQLQRDCILPPTRPDGSMLEPAHHPYAARGPLHPRRHGGLSLLRAQNCIPAKIAGVDEIVMTTPASGREVSPAILAAAKVAAWTGCSASAGRRPSLPWPTARGRCRAWIR